MTKTDLSFQKPVMNAAGTLGFSPDLKGRVEVSDLGAFVTNPVSWGPRLPAKGVRSLPYPGGLLLHTGYPNPGLNAILRSHSKRWARSPVPVIVHLMAQEAVTLGRMVQRLEGVEGVMGIEVGLPLEVDPGLISEMAQAAIGELPVILHLPLEMVMGIHRRSRILEAVGKTGISAISLAAPRGAIKVEDGSTVTGRLYGPAQLPLVLAAVRSLAELDLPVIAAGGAFSDVDVETLLAAGAMAVQLDTVLWRGGLYERKR
jgi:dihydroorotate dehydrogenase (NAD+) catalytic subunit